MNRSENIHDIINQCEGLQVEFKSSFTDDVIVSLVAFSNSKGGTVYVGITDKALIKGVSIGKETIAEWLNEIKNKTSPTIIPDIETYTIENKTLVAFKVNEYPLKPVALKGRYFKRVANANHLLTTTEVADLHLQSLYSSWDAYPSANHTIDDIDVSKIENAIIKLNKKGKSIEDKPSQFLKKYSLTRNNKITNAAYLLFKKEDCFMSTIEMGRFQNDTIIKDSARSKSDLLSQIDAVIAFVTKHINKAILITGSPQNTERWDYPLEALREIIMNMIVHRDYRSPYDSIIKVYDNKIEFYNPGILPDDITIEDLLTNNYKSNPRNKLIADFCKDLGLIEKYGSGIQRILKAFNEYDLPNPEFKQISGGFNVTVFKSKKIDKVPDKVSDKVPDKVSDKVSDKVPDKVPDPLTKTQQEILRNLISQPRMSMNDLSIKLKISKRKILDNTNKLKEMGFLLRIGNNKTGHWQVNQ